MGRIRCDRGSPARHRANERHKVARIRARRRDSTGAAVHVNLAEQTAWLRELVKHSGCQ
jgi:hypothetical protein